MEDDARVEDDGSTESTTTTTTTTMTIVTTTTTPSISSLSQRLSLTSTPSQPLLMRHRPMANYDLPRRGSETVLVSKPSSSKSSSDGEGLSYSAYLHLDSILSSQHPMTTMTGEPVHDEHLFIVVHQTYELWFKQLLFEVNSVRSLFLNTSNGDVDESSMLNIVKRMSRVNLILKLLVDQIHVLETMSALDFMAFRNVLSTASGFQSLQFRLLENRLGIKSCNRVKYNQDNYMRVFGQDLEALKELHLSETEPSLSECVQRWLEKTTGMEKWGFDFISNFQLSVDQVLNSEFEEAERESNEDRRSQLLNNVRIRREQFESIFDSEKHEALRLRGERKFTREALLAAIMINLYKDEPKFHQPWLLLEELMNVDELITRWRYNHVLLVQRMIGSQQLGSGGSSGYHYLRSTLGDRYKVFLDLFNCSTFLIPRHKAPKLTDDMKRRLRSITHQ